MEEESDKIKVVRRIIKAVDKNDNPSATRIRVVSSVLNKFFEYAYMAAIHGRHIRHSYEGGKQCFSFKMNYFYINNVPDNLKRKIKFSSKAIGYIFVLEVSIPVIKNFKYKFRVDPMWFDKVAEIAETDKVYQLIKKNHAKKVYKTRNS